MHAFKVNDEIKTKEVLLRFLFRFQALINRMENHSHEHSGDVIPIHPNSFRWNEHYYPYVIKSTLSPKVQEFLQLDNEAIVKRYCQLHTQTDSAQLIKLLQSSAKYFHWSGGDLFHVTDRWDKEQKEKMILVEVNSCPTGQKSMPSPDQSGYHDMMRRMFKPLLSSVKTQGALAVLYDSNIMETRGYAAALADVMNEKVFFVKFDYRDKPSPNIKFIDKELFVRDQTDQWYLVRAAFRFVTKKPWNRIPIDSRTLIVNPIIACLAGGRNKLLAGHAYHLFNVKYAKYDIEIRVPETIINVEKQNIPKCIKKLGGMGVIKLPYLNSGQGIYTVVNDAELTRFMNKIPASSYQSYIVQSLVGHQAWDTFKTHRYSHILTTGAQGREGFVKDLRMQICSTENGFRPASIYCRRAREPLAPDLTTIVDSWQMLGTNLSVKLDSSNSGFSPAEWTTETERLIILGENEDSGLSIDNLVDAYIQTVLGTLAIDQLAEQLVDENGKFNLRLFESLDSDDGLIHEVLL